MTSFQAQLLQLLASCPGRLCWKAWVKMRSMASKRFYSFSHLARLDPFASRYRLYVRDLNSRLLVMAPHGGCIEPGTSEIARVLAGNSLSLYCFEGLDCKGEYNLHLTSSCFDEPVALKLSRKVDTIVAIHGYRCSRPEVAVGGLDTGLQHRLVEALQAAGIQASIGSHGLAGVHPNNICNRGLTGMGVQLELSDSLRKTMFASFTPTGLQTVYPPFHTFIEACRAALTADDY